MSECEHAHSCKWTATVGSWSGQTPELSDLERQTWAAETLGCGVTPGEVPESRHGMGDGGLP